jgi:hypothetical protein
MSRLAVSDAELLIAGDIPGSAVAGMLTLHQVAQGVQLAPEEIEACEKRYPDNENGTLLRGVLAAMNSQKYQTVVDHIGEVTALRQGNGPVYEANQGPTMVLARNYSKRVMARVGSKEPLFVGND